MKLRKLNIETTEQANESYDTFVWRLCHRWTRNCVFHCFLLSARTVDMFVSPYFSTAALKTQPYDLLRWSAAYFRCLSLDVLPPVKPRYEHENVFGCLTKGYLKVLLSQVRLVWGGLVHVMFQFRSDLTFHKSTTAFNYDSCNSRTLVSFCFMGRLITVLNNLIHRRTSFDSFEGRQRIFCSSWHSGTSVERIMLARGLLIPVNGLH